MRNDILSGRYILKLSARGTNKRKMTSGRYSGRKGEGGWVRRRGENILYDTKH